MNSVSVIVPTIGRDSLQGAVESVLSQAGCVPEVIVVLDNPDRLDITSRMLERLDHTLIVADRVGAAAARNLGLEAARGDFVGYLDDDDLWLPGKAHKQIQAIRASSDPAHTFSVCASRFVRRNGKLSHGASRQYERGRMSFPNYLVERKRVRYGSVFFNTPSVLGPMEVMRKYTWDTTLLAHQDWDYFIRLMSDPSLHLQVVNEQLVEVHQGSPGSLSANPDWRRGSAFLEKHNASISGRARADFVLLHVMLPAIHARSLPGLKIALRQLHPAPPHTGALARFALGTLTRR